MTAIDEAHATHVPDDEVAKTLVVMADFGPALMIIPASRRLDMELPAQATADPQMRLATERGTIVFAAGRQDVSIRMATSDPFGPDPVVITPLTAGSRTAETSTTTPTRQA